MGLFDKLIAPIKSSPTTRGYFQMLTAYTPVFRTRAGGVYEMIRTRASIHAIANQCGKLNPKVVGTKDKSLETRLKFRPGPYQNTYQFLYQTATILLAENTVFLLPVIDIRGQTVGCFPVRPSAGCEFVEGTDGKLYLRFTFQGKRAAVDYDRCGVLTRMQYQSDMTGDSNAPLNETLDLMQYQNEAIRNGIRQAAAIRFMAKLARAVRPEDLKSERDEFAKMNLDSENNGGVMIFDTKYSDVKQIESHPFICDEKQMELINKNSDAYFGVNDDFLTNRYDEAGWDAVYESAIEPFAVQLSLEMTHMFFSDKQRALGLQIIWSANRLQFASAKTKVSIITQLFDRGMLNRDEGREIMQMEPLPDGLGQTYYIRGEYINSDEKTVTDPDDKEDEENAND